MTKVIWQITLKRQTFLELQNADSVMDFLYQLEVFQQ